MANRAAVARILIDLIKADRVIDGREIETYELLRQKFGITPEHERRAYEMSFGEAVAECRTPATPAGVSEASDLLGTFQKVTECDGTSPREEALLMLALKFCLDKNFPDSDVISLCVSDALIDERQVLYVESRHDKDVNFEISSNKRHISNELKLCGLDFVFLPDILAHYNSTDRELFDKVLKLLNPKLDEDEIRNLHLTIRLYKTDRFCVEQLSRKLGFKELETTDPALLLRISHSKVGDRIVTNFLRINLEEGSVVDTVNRIVDTFLAYHSSDRIMVSHKKDEGGSFLYSGFYRQMFEIFFMRDNGPDTLLIDLEEQKLRFLGSREVIPRITQRDRAYYVLMLFESMNLNRKWNSEEMWEPVQTFIRGEGNPEQMRVLQRRFSEIYELVGNRLANRLPDIRKSDLRTQSKSRLNGALGDLDGKVSDISMFQLDFDAATGGLSIKISPDRVKCRQKKKEKENEEAREAEETQKKEAAVGEWEDVPFLKSDLFKRLKEIR